MLGPIEAVVTSLKKYANFKGRATRSEFWWFQIFYSICFYGSQWVGQTLEVGNIIAGVVNLVLILPLLSVQVRRLHDVGWSGWWVFGIYALFLTFLIMAAFLPEKPSLPLAIFGLVNATLVLAYVLFIIAQYLRGSNAKGDKYGPSGLMNKPAETQETRAFVPQEYVPQVYVPYG